MSRRQGKRLSQAVALYEYLWNVPKGKVVTIKRTKGALWINIKDEVKNPQVTFLAFDEMEGLNHDKLL